jgi:hypothetical protein
MRRCRLAEEGAPMRKLILGCAALAVAALGCKTGAANAADYNNRIVEQQQRIMTAIAELVAGCEDAASAGCEAKYAGAVTTAEDVLKKVTAMEPFDGSTMLRDAAVKLFTFYGDVIKISYRELLDIQKLPEPTPENLQRVVEIQADVQKREAGMDAELDAAQRTFAAKYNVVLQPNAATP